MTHLNSIRVVVLGGSNVGKSAVTVRYLTKRFIGEYSSSGDFFYHHSVTFDNVQTEVEIMDTSKSAFFLCSNEGVGSCLYEHIQWADAFVVVYSIVDKFSFKTAQEFLKQITMYKLPSYFTTLLLGNKRDMDRYREVTVNEGHEMSLKYSCQFYEVSAADNFAGVSLAFTSMLREAKSVQLLKSLPMRRKLGVNSVSKVLGNIFGKNSKDKRKRPSLSI